MWRYDLSEMICKIISDRKSRHQLFDAYVHAFFRECRFDSDGITGDNDTELFSAGFPGWRIARGRDRISAARGCT